MSNLILNHFGEKVESNEYIAIVPDKENIAMIYYDTTALLIGRALQMLIVEFKERINELTDEEREFVMNQMLVYETEGAVKHE